MTAAGDARPADLRLARLHLRLGSLELARAELEAFAGAGILDAEALVDLAEVRWRTGDVSGAGVAAQAYLGEGGEAAIALVIAAEASAALGRPTEARRLAAQAIERADVPLERLFAGIPRSGIWPIEPGERPEPVGELFAIPATRPASSTRPSQAARPSDLADPGRDMATSPAASPPPASAPPDSPPSASLAAASGLWDQPADAQNEAIPSVVPPAVPPIVPPVVPPLAPAPDMTAELESARQDLLAGRRASAAVRLAVVLRIAPSLAATVVEALADVSGPTDASSAGLELVRGDAYSLVGREAEAHRAYAAVAAALERTDASGG